MFSNITSRMKCKINDSDKISAMEGIKDHCYKDGSTSIFNEPCLEKEGTLAEYLTDEL